MRIVGGNGGGAGSDHIAPDDKEVRMRYAHTALSLAIEWARSSGPEHSTRVQIDDFIEAANKIYAFLQGTGKP